MRMLLRQLEDMADLVIIDAPPVLPVTDAAVLSTVASGALLVVYAGRTRREQVRLSLTSIKAVDGRVLGIVLNKAPTRGQDAYYSYQHSYKYDGVGAANVPAANVPAVNGSASNRVNSSRTVTASIPTDATPSVVPTSSAADGAS